MISDHTAMTNPMPTTIPAGGSNTDKIMTGVAIGAFFYFDLGQFLSLTSLKENRDRLLAVTLVALMAMVPILCKNFAHKFA
ncbi:MAG: hypothetical protein ACHQWV_01820 [Nitrospirales bacterium]